MVQILPQLQKNKRSFGEQVLAGVNEFIPQVQQFLQQQQLMQQQQQQEQLQQQQQQEQRQQMRQFGEQLGLGDISGLSPEIQKTVISEALKGQSKEKLLGKKLGAVGGLFGKSQQNIPENVLGESSPNLKEQQSLGINPANISDEDILQLSAIDPQLGNAARGLKDVALREQRAAQEFGLKKEKFTEEQKKASPEYIRERQIETAQAQADVKYNQQLQENQKQQELKQQTLERLDKLNKKGVTGKPYEKLLEKMGLVALTSEGRREFAADVKNLITDIRSILGAQFTGFEFQTILNAYPSPDFSKEANDAIIKNLKDFQDIKRKEVEVAKDLKKENKGKVPFDFQSQVNERVHQYALSKVPDIRENTRKIMNEEYGIKPGFVLMFDNKGEPLNVPEDQVQFYEGLGAVLP